MSRCDTRRSWYEPEANPTVGIKVDDVPYGGSTIAAGRYFVPDIDPVALARVARAATGMWR